jgi:hypothetical protein
MTKQEKNALNELVKIIDELVKTINKMVFLQIILVKSLTGKENN